MSENLDNIIDKEIHSFFGEDGYLFEAKINEYFNKQIPKDIILTQYFITKYKNINDFDDFNSELLSVLYYLLDKGSEYREKYTNILILLFKTRGNLNIDRETLYKLYNIIEIEDTYRISTEIYIQQQLFEYLKIFAEMPKNLYEYILFKYYFIVLFYNMGSYEKGKEGVIKICNEDLKKEMRNSKKDNMFYKYLMNKLYLLKWRLDQMKFNDNISEIESLSNYLVKEFEKKDHIENVAKMKIALIEVYKSRNELIKSLQILKELYKNIKEAIYQNKKFEHSEEIILQILSQMAYCYIMQGDRENMDKIVKKIDKKVQILSKKNQIKIKNDEIEVKYSFFLLICKYIFNNGILDGNYSKVLSIFYDVFDKRISEENNINIYAINFYERENLTHRKYLDNKKEFTKIISNYNNILNRRKNIPIKNLIMCMISVYNNIVYLSKEKISTTKNEIQNQSSLLINYIKDSLEESGEESIMKQFFKFNYMKNLLINIIYTYLFSFFLDQEVNTSTIHQNLQSFNSIFIDLNADNIPAYSLIERLQGDIYFKESKYDKAIKHYEQGIHLLNDRKEKVKAELYFNKGIAEGIIGKTRESQIDLEKSLNEFKDHCKEDKDNNTLKEKMAIVRNLISELEINTNDKTLVIHPLKIHI